MAESAVKLVAATVESLYVSSRPAPVALTWETALLALAAGTGVAVLSALLPAWEAAQVRAGGGHGAGPARAPGAGAQWRGLAGAALLAGGRVDGRRGSPPSTASRYSDISRRCSPSPQRRSPFPPWWRGWPPPRRAPCGACSAWKRCWRRAALAGSLRRTSVLVGALATAVAMMAAVGIMVGSFRQTVLLWMEDRLQADLYLRPAGAGGADRHPTMSAEIPGPARRACPRWPRWTAYRAYEISYQGLPATLGGGRRPHCRPLRRAGRFSPAPSRATVFDALDARR